MNVTLFATKIHLYNGETASLRVEIGWTIGKIMDELWLKKRLTDRQNGFVLRLAKGEVYFDNSDPFNRVLEMENLFADDHNKKLVELWLLENPWKIHGKDEINGVSGVGGLTLAIPSTPRSHLTSGGRKGSVSISGWATTPRPASASSTPQKYETAAAKMKEVERTHQVKRDLPILKQGYLYKLSKGSTKDWRKRYFVIQDMFMYYFETEIEFTEGKSSHAVIPIGACEAILTETTTEENGKEKKKKKKG